jgi:hypothetical protein
MTRADGLRRLAGELGPAGLAALALLAGAATFVPLALEPLEARDRLLGEQLARAARQAPARARDARAAQGAQLEAFYRYFETGRDPVEWLAKLYGIGRAVGLELGAGEYRARDTGTRLERYEIVLPLAGSYSQVRAFVKNALLEIPVLALEQLNIRRERASDGTARAEVRFALYLPRP